MHAASAVSEHRLTRLLHASSPHHLRLTRTLEPFDLTPESFLALSRCAELEGVTYWKIGQGRSSFENVHLSPNVKAELTDRHLIKVQKIDYLGIEYVNLTVAGRAIIAAATSMLYRAYQSIPVVSATVLHWPEKIDNPQEACKLSANAEIAQHPTVDQGEQFEHESVGDPHKDAG